MMRSHFYLNSKLVLCLYLSLMATGCSSTKYSWQEWMDADDSQQMVHEAKPGPWTEPHVKPLVLAEGYAIGDAARVGRGFDLAMRNPNFPDTYIDRVYVDLTDPNHEIWIQWTGPQAELGPRGPWSSNPGRGKPDCDCNDFDASNTVDSWCTPKGLFPVAGFADRLEGVRWCHYVTWIQYAPRYVGLHSHSFIPTWADSHGCVRLPYDVAKLIHNNSLVGTTMVSIDGTWTRREPRVWE
ncbi:MAG: L,D-transpeptidase [Planctomycetes bacterium]|nr:L,D-transpeptidase [Planctomycetota bacterium]MCB9910162.1 L,D-transpeptidase [Planctomycetota bacterium]HPF15470.1 L,D-transpeptidase [Planctomycetota bacterium]